MTTPWWIDRALAPLDRLGMSLQRMARARWWVWPGFLVGLALVTWATSLVVEPRPDEWSYVFGRRVGDTCAWIQMTGQPCPSCGMTRSFAHAARFHLLRSLAYNPAGFVLFWWIQAAGIVGAVRLFAKDPDRLEPPHRWFLAWILTWAGGLYMLPWFLRVAGFNPLP